MDPMDTTLATRGCILPFAHTIPTDPFRISHFVLYQTKEVSLIIKLYFLNLAGRCTNLNLNSYPEGERDAKG